ncbi:hypothetical protein F4680DRAFT_453107 [Xylaria scruposa]|nr:hypothetical protein F4680DRAFT_453107 [Xylaria scruposa]
MPFYTRILEGFRVSPKGSSQLGNLQTTLTTIVKPVEADVDIVAIHGLNPVNLEGQASSTWTAGDKLWLQDFLPEKAPRIRVLLFGYNSNVAFSTATAGVREVAENLLNLLASQRDDPYRPLIFVCHSLGGLVVKRAIVHARSDETYETIRTSIRGLAFFSTPHRGGNNVGYGDTAARVARFVLGNPENTFMEALKGDSLFADSMADDFRQRLLDFKIISFYETRPYGNFGLVVNKHSATLGLPGSHEKQIALNANHRHMCKFESAEDPIYQQVEINLLEMIQDAASYRQWPPTGRAMISKMGINGAVPPRTGNVAIVAGDDNLTHQAGRHNQSNTEGYSNMTRQLGDSNLSAVIGRGNRTDQFESGQGLSLETIKLFFER